MPKYRLTGPDGKVYMADAPDPEAAAEAAQQLFGGAADGTAAPGAGDGGGMGQGDKTVGGAMLDIAAAGARAAPGFIDQAGRSLAKGVTTILGAPQGISEMQRGALKWGAEKLGVPMGGQAEKIINAQTALADLWPSADMMQRSLDTANNATADLFGVTRPRTQPVNLAERMSNRVFEEIGAAAVPGTAAAYKALQGVDAARKLPGIVRHVVEPIAIAPGRAAGREAATAVAAGTGAAVVNEATGKAQVEAAGGTPTFKQLAGDLGGALAGPPVLQAARMGLGAGNTILRAIFGSPDLKAKVVQEAVADTLLDNSTIAGRSASPGEPIDTRALVEAINRPSQAEAVIPGYRATTADRAGDRGLALLESERATRPSRGYGDVHGSNVAAVDQAVGGLAPTETPGAFSASLAAARDAEITAAIARAAGADEAVVRALEALVPGTTAQVRGAAVRTAADDALVNFIAPQEAARAAAAQNAETAAAALRPVSTPETRGNIVRSATEDAREAARQRTDEAHRNRGLDDALTDSTALREALDEVSSRMTVTERGLAPQALLDRVRALGEPVETGLLDASGNPIMRGAAPVRLEEATTLLSELKRYARAASSDPNAEKGGRNAARVIGNYITATADRIRASVTPEQWSAIEAAAGAKLDEVEAFGRQGDPIAAILARREGGRPQMSDERVAGSLVNPATDQPLQRLFAEADTPAVRAAIRDEIASQMPRNATPEQLDRFLADYDIPLRNFPQLRQEIEAAAAAQRGVGAADAALTARRQEFHGDSRALAEATRRRPDGTPTVPDEGVAGSFVNTGGNRDLDALFQRADTPEVRSAIRDEIASKVPANATAAATQRFLDNYTEPLKRFPQLRQEIEAVVAARTSADEATAARKATERDLGPGGKSPVAQYLQHGAEVSEDAMRGVIGSDKPGEAMDALLAATKGDARAREGAKAAFWKVLDRDARAKNERARTDGGTMPIVGERLLAFLDDPHTMAVAQRLYSDQSEHLDHLRQIGEALRGVGLARKTGSAINPSGTALMARGAPPVTLAEAGSKYYQFQIGRLSPTYMATYLAGKFARGAVSRSQAAAAEKLLDKVMQNPELAAALLKDNNPANRAALARTAKAYLGNEAATVVEMLQPEEEDPVKAAVQR